MSPFLFGIAVIQRDFLVVYFSLCAASPSSMKLEQMDMWGCHLIDLYVPAISRCLDRLSQVLIAYAWYQKP